MQVRAGYKATDVGLIPLDWRVVYLGDVSVISRLAGAEYTSLWSETPTGEIIALRGFNIGQGKIVDRDFARISNSLSMKLKRSRLCKGDVVYPCVGSIGNAAVIDEDNKYHIQQNIARITPAAMLISSRYLANYLMSSLGESEVERFNSSSSQPSVLVGNLRKYRIALPPTKTEQELIASHLADIDALIAGLERLIAKKRDIKQATMQQLLTGQTRLPGFSGEWEVKQLGEIARLYQPQTISQGEFRDYGYPVFGANGVVGMYEKFNHETPQITISCRGNCGTVNRTSGPAWITGNAMVVNLDGASDIDKDFVYYALTFSDLSVLVTGSGIPQIVRDPLSGFAIELPKNVAEQTAIATVLSDMDADLSALEARLAKTRAIKQGMMQELLTGRTRLVGNT
jgi:type I restriction enzyme S subunit